MTGRLILGQMQPDLFCVIHKSNTPPVLRALLGERHDGSRVPVAAPDGGDQPQNH